MSIKWYFFSDTNSAPGELMTNLEKYGYSLISTNKLESLHQHFIQNEQVILFLKANVLFNVYDLCKEVSILYPHVYIILMVPDNMENLKKAMHMGASDILRSSYTLEELRESVLQARKYMEHKANKDSYSINLSNKDSKVIAIAGPKGGIGRTSLTINLAVAFVKTGKKVAVIDGNLQFGDAAMFYNLKPKRTIYEWVKEAYGRPEFSIDKYMSVHQSGVSVLAAPSRPEFFEGITEEHIKKAIKETKSLFDIVLIDAPAYLSEIHLCCLDQADEILLISQNNISVLRATKLYLDTLESINLKDKVRLILNRHKKKKGLEIKKIKEICDNDIFYTLPEQEKVIDASITMGNPFVLENARCELSKGVIKLCERLLINPNEEIVTRKKDKQWFAFS